MTQAGAQANGAPHGTAVVTGGRRGIGRGIAVELAKAGFDVVIMDLQHDDDVDETLAQLAEHGRRSGFVALDVRDLSQHDRALAELKDAFRVPDCLINNAGMAPHVRADLLEVSPDSFDDVLSVNLRGAFFLTQAVAKQMLDEGERTAHPRSIINVSSRSAVAASIDRGEYCISKAGMSMMTKLFAQRLAATNIAVFEVRPGIIDTPMTASPAVHEKHSRFIERGGVPALRWGVPEDVGKAVAALASGAFSFSTGTVVEVDGGLSVERL